MQAIITKVIPATNSRPTRIKASCARGSFTAAYDFKHGVGDEQSHREVAAALLKKFLCEDEAIYKTRQAENPWSKPFVTGCLPSGEFAHVLTEASAIKIAATNYLSQNSVANRAALRSALSL